MGGGEAPAVRVAMAIGAGLVRRLEADSRRTERCDGGGSGRGASVAGGAVGGPVRALERITGLLVRSPWHGRAGEAMDVVAGGAVGGRARKQGLAGMRIGMACVAARESRPLAPPRLRGVARSAREGAVPAEQREAGAAVIESLLPDL